MFISRTSPHVSPVNHSEIGLSESPQNKAGSIMKKTKEISLRILSAVLTALPMSMSANISKLQPIKTPKPIVSLQVEGIDWVKECIHQYPEILWLADANVRKTEDTNVQRAGEGKPVVQGPYSEQLFGKKFIEFDRTIMTLRCLQLILDGSDRAYEEFTAAQPADAKLQRESFEKLHLQGIFLTNSKLGELSELEMTQAMEAALVLGDIGKSEKARELFKPYGASAPDHDDFRGEVMAILENHPEICPTFEKLTPSARKLLIQTANLAHYGHMTHIEGGPGMYSRLKESEIVSESPLAFMFDFFVHTCDVAGALGHVNPRSSLVYLESTHRGMQAVADACLKLADPKMNEMDAYNAYLAIRAGWLGLNPEDRIERVLTRVGTMLRLFTPEEGQVLKKAVLEFDEETRAKVIGQLDAQDFERTPTYMPAVLTNLLNNIELGSNREERLSKAVVLGLPFLAKVLEKHKETLSQNKADSQIPLNFNKAAGIAKSSAIQLANEFEIDLEGNVLVSEIAK